MLVTNLKQVTIAQQSSPEMIEKLKSFAEELFQAHNLEKGEELVAEDYLQDNGELVYYDLPKTMDTNLPLNMGCVLKAFNGTSVIQKPGKVIETIKYQFTQEEHQSNCDQLARYNIEHNQIENEKKEVMSSYKAKLDENRARIDKFANYVSNGFEVKEENCEVFLDFDRKKRVYKSIRTGAIVKETDFYHDDLQMVLEFN